jgi:hypothetical protein
MPADAPTPAPARPPGQASPQPAAAPRRGLLRSGSRIWRSGFGGLRRLGTGALESRLIARSIASADSPFLHDAVPRLLRVIGSGRGKSLRRSALDLRPMAQRQVLAAACDLQPSRAGEEPGPRCQVVHARHAKEFQNIFLYPDRKRPGLPDFSRSSRLSIVLDGARRPSLRRTRTSSIRVTGAFRPTTTWKRKIQASLHRIH